MVDTGRVELILELDREAEPISGVLRTSSGPQAFRGWIQLAALLDAVRGWEGAELTGVERENYA